MALDSHALPLLLLLLTPLCVLLLILALKGKKRTRFKGLGAAGGTRRALNQLSHAPY